VQFGIEPNITSVRKASRWSLKTSTKRDLLTVATNYELLYPTEPKFKKAKAEQRAIKPEDP